VYVIDVFNKYVLKKINETERVNGAAIRQEGNVIIREIDNYNN